jgi:hypothetical protein
MELDAQVIQDAARLLAFGLQAAQRPSQSTDYRALIERYRNEPIVERVVREVARGLGLRVLDVSDYGLVLAADPDSPFNLTVADYRTGLSTEERLLHGLCQVGLAAYLYPRPEDLESEAEVRQVCVRDLDAFLRDACGRVAAETAAADPPTDQPELEQACRIYLRWPATKETADGRRAAKTTQGVIAQALERLADHGLLRRAGDDGGGTYQALRRYRVHVREVASHEALRILRGEAA